MQDDVIAQLERERPRFLMLVNVDTSWLRRPGSSPRLMRWADATVNASYRPIGLVEIAPDGERRATAGATPPPRRRARRSTSPSSNAAHLSAAIAASA